MIIDKPKQAEEVINKYSELIGKGLGNLCKNICIKRFDLNCSLVEFEFKDGTTCILDIKNTINVIVGKSPYKEPLQFDDKLSDSIYAMTKIYEVIRETACIVNMIAEDASNLDRVYKLIDREKFLYKGPFKIVQENKRIIIS